MIEEMEPKAMEGTWEELLERSHEFTGRRFRLLPLDEPEVRTTAPAYPEGETLDKVLAPFLQQMNDLPLPEEPPAHTDPHEQEISRLVAEKFRKQGFDV